MHLASSGVKRMPGPIGNSSQCIHSIKALGTPKSDHFLAGVITRDTPVLRGSESGIGCSPITCIASISSPPSKPALNPIISS
jgi:hypothetical protein